MKCKRVFHISNKKFDLEAAVTAVNIFFSNDVKHQKLSPRVTDAVGDFQQLDSGIYNTFTVYSGKKIRFNAGLIKELKQIGNATDKELSKTALRKIFSKSDPKEKLDSDELQAVTIEHKSSALPIPFLPFNYEQENPQGHLLVVSPALEPTRLNRM